MSSRKKSGSRYRKKIDILYFLVSYEGGEDERKYFESMKNAISRRFENLVYFTPVEKTDVHHSTPQHVLNDLENKAAQLNYKLKDGNVHGFIAFDVDHYFSEKHQKKRKRQLRKLSKKAST
ncbi:RloB domain-containing protein [Pseudoalteromonas sp. SR43-6]|uniref:RloB domain-containing protein n=1 Tax=unclassified Pseudoalteromonas TaxID=194690 RepID=UPI0015FA0FD6|nr:MULTISPECIES: RloB domain-containing protein [unclassified Pseudoalteromonas]MBB1291169.1 RloB domain-containing protein [Pseudoalteromonas sp. SR41-5]MBB1376405.1 RloB domain-containing protein [Pseudoalteromonas sp. SR43-6]MBB1415548.1 RloB domain-containing protein [Pseudoalteromonas sp. SG43-8]